MEKKFNNSKFQGKKKISFSKDKPKFEGREKKFNKDSSHSNEAQKTTNTSKEKVRLNRFIANAGICSRREADSLISDGVVELNGKICTELGTKVSFSDIVKVNGKQIEGEKKVYLLLNKPKDYITTMDDPKGRKTVLDLVDRACPERIYPVGR